MRLTSIALLIFATTTAATAQEITQPRMQTRYPDITAPFPRTVPWTDAQGNVIGSATFSGLHIYLRDAKGELFAQVLVEADGTQKLLDPSGKLLDTKLPGKIPEAQ